MRVVCISDTHEDHRSLGTVPECDVLVHSGDSVKDFGSGGTGGGKDKEFQDFLDWFSSQPAEHKIFVGGNHDHDLYHADSRKRFERMFPEGVTYLRDSEIIIEGRKFYGTPWQPYFCDMAFNIKSHGDRLKKMEMIPDDTEVLITHTPPKQILDRVPASSEYRQAYGFPAGNTRKDFEYHGCGALAKQLKRLNKLRLHTFGHVHFSAGHTMRDGVCFVNAAMCGPTPYQIVNEPITVDILQAGTLVCWYQY